MKTPITMAPAYSRGSSTRRCRDSSQISAAALPPRPLLMRSIPPSPLS